MRYTLAIASLLLLLSVALAGRISFAAENKTMDFTASGYIDGTTFHLEFEGNMEYFKRSILFVFKVRQDNWCPSFAVIFSEVQTNSPLAYVAAACNESEEKGAEPKLMEDLAVDFDREYDIATEDRIKFKGTVNYKKSIDLLTNLDKIEYLYIRGLKKKHGGAGNVFETEGTVKHE